MSWNWCLQLSQRQRLVWRVVSHHRNNVSPYRCVNLLSYCRRWMFKRGQIIPWGISLTENSGYCRTVLSTLWTLGSPVKNFVVYGTKGVSPSQLHRNSGEFIWFPIVLCKKILFTPIPSRYRTCLPTETWESWWGIHQGGVGALGKIYVRSR